MILTINSATIVVSAPREAISSLPIGQEGDQ